MVRKHDFMVPAVITFAVTLLIYLQTMSRSVGWHDSAELALTAWLFAANHAPGSPLHTLLAYVPVHLFSEPHIGTTLVSVVAAALAAGVLGGLIGRLTGNAWVATGAALIFALSFQVWAAAVITELYSLGALMLGLAMYAAYCWQSTRSKQSWLMMLLAYGLALGAYFANVLVWPAFALLIYKCADRPLRQVFLFGCCSA